MHTCIHTDRQTYRHTDIQTYTHTDIYIYKIYALPIFSDFGEPSTSGRRAGSLHSRAQPGPDVRNVLWHAMPGPGPGHVLYQGPDGDDVDYDPLDPQDPKRCVKQRTGYIADTLG